MRTVVRRGHQIESEHRVCGAVIDADGSLEVLGGDGAAYLRSMAKPFQTLALLRAGVAHAFELTDEELAVITASHAGESYHHELVQSLLDRHGLRSSQLLCGTHAPFSRSERQRRLRAAEPLSVLGNNCSGKHTGMLLFARSLGGDLSRYLEVDHPVQLAIRGLLELFVGEAFEPGQVGVDGCGVPTFHLSMSSMARAFWHLRNFEFLEKHDLRSEADRLHAAIDAHPRAFSGEGRLPYRWRTFLAPEFRCKEGAEGGLALWGSRGALIVKSIDGDERGVRWLVPELLAKLGWISENTRAQWLQDDPPIVRNVAGRDVGRVEVEL